VPARPPGPPPLPAAARAPFGSAPEIIIVGVETHVVPSESADAKVLDAIGRLARLRQPSDPTLAQLLGDRCAACGYALERRGAACPACGT
jgi:hypothetical protein